MRHTETDRLRHIAYKFSEKKDKRGIERKKAREREKNKQINCQTGRNKKKNVGKKPGRDGEQRNTKRKPHIQRDLHSR